MGCWDDGIDKGWMWPKRSSTKRWVTRCHKDMWMVHNIGQKNPPNGIGTTVFCWCFRGSLELVLGS